MKKKQEDIVKHFGYVAVVGRTNAGKSTFLNQALGEKVSIVSDKPQTTRRRILGVQTDRRGQMVFFDTPGVHRPGHELNRRMVQYIHDSIGTADVLLHMVDVSQSFGKGEEFVLELVRAAGKPTVLALNKIDLLRKSKLLEIIDFYRQKHEYAAFVPLSALNNDGVDVVVEELFKLLPEGQPLYDDDYLTDATERFLVTETVREKLLAHTREELPFTTAVIVEAFDESEREEKGAVQIDACIVVEKESQKAIVIGKGGSMLKLIGSEARKDIERMLLCHVYLKLFVKVEENWRDNSRFLHDLGVGE